MSDGHIEIEDDGWDVVSTLEYVESLGKHGGSPKLAKACRKVLKELKKAGLICGCKACYPKVIKSAVETPELKWPTEAMPTEKNPLNIPAGCTWIYKM